MMIWHGSASFALKVFLTSMLGLTWVQHEARAVEPGLYSVVGKGQLKVVPDRLSVVFDFGFKADPSLNYLKRYTESYSELMSALAPFDVSDQHVRIYSFRVIADPNFWMGRMGSVEVKSTITVTIPNQGAKSDLFAAIQQAPDVKRFREVYSRSDEESLRLAVDKMAIANAIELTRSVALASGLTPGRVISIGEQPTEADLSGANVFIEPVSVTKATGTAEAIVFSSEVRVVSELQRVK